MSADARKFGMGGTWIARRGGVFVPLQFAQSGMGTQMTQVSMGSLTFALGFPNGPIGAGGIVTATGSAPATLRIPRHRFVMDAATAFPLAGITLVQIATTLHVDAPFETASLAPQGGPGSFTWCPVDPDCVDLPGTRRSTDPPQGAAATNGRVIYRAGANRFGGVIRLGLSGSRLLSVRHPADPARIRHYEDGPGPTLLPGAPGGSYGFTQLLPSAGFVVTRPVGFVPGLLITQPGPRVTTMGGYTDTGTGPTRVYPTIYGPLLERGFPATTGTVFVQQTTGSGGDAFFTAMGSDLRTPLGAGNISLVSGGLAHSVHGSSIYFDPRARFDEIRLSLSPQVPSLTRAGVVAAAALVLLGAGYAGRRGRSARRR